MQAFVDALDDLYADDNVGTDVVWTPARGGGVGYTLRALRMSGDQVAQLDGIGDRITAVRHVRVLAATVESLAPGLKPGKGDLVLVDGETRTVSSPGRKEDDFRLQWTLDLG